MYDFIAVPPETPVFKVGTQQFDGILYVIEGDNITVTCDSANNPRSSFFVWTGQSLESNNLTLHNIQPSQAGTYNCTTRNATRHSGGLVQKSLTVIVMSA